MAITIEKTIHQPEADFVIKEHEAATIKRIADKVGKIEAIVVTRWKTGCSLLTAKNFVEGM